MKKSSTKQQQIQEITESAMIYVAMFMNSPDLVVRNAIVQEIYNLGFDQTAGYLIDIETGVNTDEVLERYFSKSEMKPEVILYRKLTNSIIKFILKFI